MPVIACCCCAKTNLSKVGSRLAPSQWETPLQSNAVSHWLGANLESTLLSMMKQGSLWVWAQPIIDDVIGWDHAQSDPFKGTVNRQRLWCWLCLYCWHRRLSLWQPTVPIMTTILTSSPLPISNSWQTSFILSNLVYLTALTCICMIQKPCL